MIKLGQMAPNNNNGTYNLYAIQFNLHKEEHEL